MKLYNTLTRSVEDLSLNGQGRVKLYTCGLTVYSQPHIGNWLGYIYWDILVRTLQAQGYSVERTQNITDVGHLTSDDDNGEDKMEKGARAEGLTAWDIAKKYISVAEIESSLLGLAAPTHLVRATAMIEQQISFAKDLNDKGYLYEIPGDGMYFDTSKSPEYGKLARLDIEGLEAGSRVSVEGKRNITDFAVWKFSPSDTNRDMEWESPWGIGFPGWHLECSVIARETLGDQIDIHTGGIDHIPVHHINEIAQTEAVTGKTFSRFWLHNNHLKADGKKISKSLGNTFTIQDILDHGYSLDEFRVFSLGKHYRTEGNFTWGNLEAASNRLKHWREATALYWQETGLAKINISFDLAQFETELNDTLSNDLDTPGALRLLDNLAESVLAGRVDRATVKSCVRLVDDHLGINLAVADISEDSKLLLTQREQARTNQNWLQSDEIRVKLRDNGIEVSDTTLGPRWYWL